MSKDTTGELNYSEDFEDLINGENQSEKDTENNGDKDDINPSKDKELAKYVEKAIDGNNDDVSDLCTKILKPVLYSVMRSVKNNFDAEDITQEVMLKVCQNIKKIRKPEYFPLWLNKVIANEINRYMVKKGVHEKPLENLDDYSEILEEDENYLPAEIIMNKEAFKAISELINSLPEKQQLVIRLKYYEGLDVSEITKVMGLARTSVSTHLARAHSKLKVEIEKIADTIGGRAGNIVSFGTLMTEFLRQDVRNFTDENAAWIAELLAKCEPYVNASAVENIAASVGTAGAAGAAASGESGATAASAAGTAGTAGAGAASTAPSGIAAVAAAITASSAALIICITSIALVAGGIIFSMLYFGQDRGSERIEAGQIELEDGELALLRALTQGNITVPIQTPEGIRELYIDATTTNWEIKNTAGEQITEGSNATEVYAATRHLREMNYTGTFEITLFVQTEEGTTELSRQITLP